MDLHTYIMFYLVGIVGFVLTGVVLTVQEFHHRVDHLPDRLSAAKVVHSTGLDRY